MKDELTFQQCIQHVQALVIGQIKLLAYRVNCFVKETLRLLLSLPMKTTSITYRITPLLDFLEIHFKALQLWLYDDVFTRVQTEIWHCLVDDYSGEIDRLVLCRENTEVKAKLMIQALGVLIQFFHEKGKVISLQELADDASMISFRLNLYTEPTERLIALYHELNDNFFDDDVDSICTTFPSTVYLEQMLRELHAIKKCFSGKELIDWIIKNPCESQLRAPSRSSRKTPSDNADPQQTAMVLAQKLLDEGIICSIDDKEIIAIINSEGRMSVSTDTSEMDSDYYPPITPCESGHASRAMTMSYSTDSTRSEPNDRRDSKPVEIYVPNVDRKEMTDCQSQTGSSLINNQPLGDASVLNLVKECLQQNAVVNEKDSLDHVETELVRENDGFSNPDVVSEIEVENSKIVSQSTDANPCEKNYNESQSIVSNYRSKSLDVVTSEDVVDPENCGKSSRVKAELFETTIDEIDHHQTQNSMIQCAVPTNLLETQAIAIDARATSAESNPTRKISVASSLKIDEIEADAMETDVMEKIPTFQEKKILSNDTSLKNQPDSNAKNTTNDSRTSEGKIGELENEVTEIGELENEVTKDQKILSNVEIASHEDPSYINNGTGNPNSQNVEINSNETQAKKFLTSSQDEKPVQNDSKTEDDKIVPKNDNSILAVISKIVEASEENVTRSDSSNSVRFDDQKVKIPSYGTSSGTITPRQDASTSGSTMSRGSSYSNLSTSPSVLFYPSLKQYYCFTSNLDTSLEVHSITSSKLGDFLEQVQKHPHCRNMGTLLRTAFEKKIPISFIVGILYSRRKRCKLAKRFLARIPKEEVNEVKSRKGEYTETGCFG